MLRSSALLASLGLCLVACGQGRTVDAAPDASAPVTPSAPPAGRATQVLGALARVPGLDVRLAGAGVLERVAEGYRLPASPWVRPFATLRRRSVEPVRLAGEGDGVYLELRPEGLADVAAAEGPKGLVYADVAPETDLVWWAGPGSAEEVRVLRGPSAPTVARWSIARGPALPGLRVHDGRVEALDAEGRVRLFAEAPFAVDAAGRRRALTWSLHAEGGASHLSATLDATGLSFPIHVDPLWMNASGALPSTAYYEASGAKLPSGKVVVFGYSSTVPQMFDLTTRTFSAGASLLVAHTQTPSMLLGTGKVLVASDGTPNAELWSETGSVATGPMSTTRAELQLVQTGFGTGAEAVYFFGGRQFKGSSTTWATAEKYVVSTGLFQAIANLPATRYGSANIALGDGKILLAGGAGASGQYDTAVLYDPVGNTYESLASIMPQKQWYPQPFLLSSGKVLIVGGWSSPYVPTQKTCIYDPTSKTFSPGPSMAYERSDFGFGKLSGNRWAVFGGRGRLVGTGTVDSLSTVEIYDEAGNSWSAGPSMSVIRERAITVPLGSERFLVAGGVSGSVYATTAELFVPDPVTCTSSGAGCPNCVDGYCCDRPCTGQCEACDLAGSLGFCDVVVGAPVHGARPACTPTILCGTGGACLATCSADGACGTGKYCSGGACYAKKAPGVACAGTNECTSGFCVDGVCCDTPCTGQCQACDVPTKLGTCSNVTGPTHGARAACTGGFGCDGSGVCATGCTTSAVCAPAYRCDTGTGKCVLKLSNGTACSVPTDCASNQCVDGVCCASACLGSCQACDVAGSPGVCTNVPSGKPHGARSCGSYAACSAGVCVTTCGDSTECAPGSFCVGGACVTQKNNGEGCGTNLECKSGQCAAGVCCDRACPGECESCALAGAVGTCKFRPGTDACGIAGCVGSTLVTRGTCSGSSAACTPGTATPCPNSLKCASGSACLSTCLSDADCASGTCDTVSGKCGPGAPDAGGDAGGDTGGGDTGGDDTGASDAGTDTGTDVGVDALPSADAPAPTLPAKPEVKDGFQRCAKNAECSTGHCVDGVCCDTACTDRCHSCALLSNPGKCTLAPIGVDLRNDCGAANTCLGTCGPAGECVGAGKGTMCGRNRCTGPSTGVGPAYCAGPGATCPTDDAVTFDCAPYVCEPAFGACVDTCHTSQDCANGYACDTTTQHCVDAAIPAADGGCATSGPGGRTGGLAFGIAALVVGLARRRGR